DPGIFFPIANGCESNDREPRPGGRPEGIFPSPGRFPVIFPSVREPYHQAELMTTDDFLRRQLIPLAYRQLPAGELMTRSQAGDPEAFVALVCLKYPTVEAVCRAAVGPTGPAEDLAQEAFVQLWRQRDRLRDPKAVDGWLAQTARNLARKFVASQ